MELEFPHLPPRVDGVDSLATIRRYPIDILSTQEYYELWIDGTLLNFIDHTHLVGFLLENKQTLTMEHLSHFLPIHTTILTLVDTPLRT